MFWRFSTFEGIPAIAADRVPVEVDREYPEALDQDGGDWAAAESGLASIQVDGSSAKGG
jgi:hypothetical protein